MENVVISDFSEEMKPRYLDYAMNVIADRALPDVRDGCKPIHRRILYDMGEELGMTYDKPYKKSARAVGDILGKFHPHGDSSIYGAIVRMAQDFSLRYPLIDGHGNWGSIDGDSAAAMRYTEARLQKIANYMLQDINSNTVDFKPNFDGEEQEPRVLPSRFPNLIVNGSDGIAVGLATHIPSHNLNETIKAIIYQIDNPNCEIKNLLKFIKAPDFCTGCDIINPQDMLDLYTTGTGKITMRATYHIETTDKIKSIVFTTVPYQTNKAKIVENIADLISNKDKILKEVIDVRDESDKDGLRLVVDLKLKSNENKILARLFTKTKLQDNYNAIFNALVNKEPKTLNIKDMIKYYIEFQKEVIYRKSVFNLKKINDRIHILNGLITAIDKIDYTIQIIRGSSNSNEAKTNLINKLNIDEIQAKAILDLKLQRLTNIDRENINKELQDLSTESIKLNKIINDNSALLNELKTDLSNIAKEFGDKRRSKLIYENAIEEITQDDLIEDYNCQIVLTNDYIKKNRKYSDNQTVKEGDSVKEIVQVNNKQNILFISNQGKVFTKLVNDLVQCQPSELGDFQPNILPLQDKERIISAIVANDKSKNILFITKEGKVLILNTQDMIGRTKQFIKLQSDKFDNNEVIAVINILDDLDTIHIQTKKKKDIEINLLDNNQKSLQYFEGKINNSGNFIYNCRQKKDEIISIVKPTTNQTD